MRYLRLVDDDLIRRAIASRQAWFEDQVLAGLTGGGLTTNTVCTVPQQPLDLDQVERMLIGFAQRFPRETWLQSRWFPDKSAIRLEASGENFLLAGAPFWRDADRVIRQQVEVTNSAIKAFGFDPTPADIDPCDSDDDALRAWKRAVWARVGDALEVAMIPLPEWLRAQRQSQ